MQNVNYPFDRGSILDIVISWKLTRDINFGVLAVKRGDAESGQVDVKRRGEMGEIPVLHDDQQVHDQDEGRQERTGQLCVTTKDGHFPLDISLFLERL
jgi:hypothetical protein